MCANLISKLPGDVILYHGSGLISWAIRFFDGTDANHAGVYLGNDSVGEALSHGLVTRDYPASKQGNHVWIRRLKNTPSTMQPVLDVAQRYLGGNYKYGYSQIVLLAFLAMSRKVKITPIFNRLLRALLDKAAATLDGIVSGDEKHMICSEFVYRCYDEALPDQYDIYTLRVAGFKYPDPVLGAGDVRALLLARGFPGRGVHPESLLALWNQAPAQTWLTPRFDMPRFEERAEPTDEEIEALLARYQDEVQNSAMLLRFSAEEEVPLAELRLAADHFARKLAALVAPREMPLTATLTGSLAFLASPPVVAMFVTPGDLLNCDNLSTMAYIP